MTHDSDISRLQGQWQVLASSSRGQALAAGPKLPDGLTYFAPGLIGTRLAILFAAGVVPLLIFALLI